MAGTAMFTMNTSSVAMNTARARTPNTIPGEPAPGGGLKGDDPGASRGSTESSGATESFACGCNCAILEKLNSLDKKFKLFDVKFNQSATLDPCARITSTARSPGPSTSSASDGRCSSSASS